MAKINFKIATPERVVFKDEVDQITLPTKEGEITILPGHIPLVAMLIPGELLVKKDKLQIPMAVSGGFIEVLPDKVVVLADTAERVEELDMERAELARKRALEALKTKKVDAREFAGLRANLEREMARLKVAKKYRHKLEQPRNINIRE